MQYGLVDAALLLQNLDQHIFLISYLKFMKTGEPMWFSNQPP